MYERHIEGKVDPSSRVADRPATVAWDPNKYKAQTMMTNRLSALNEGDGQRGSALTGNVPGTN